jgi:AP2 domain
MMTVSLSGEKAAGRVAFVDDGDYELACQHSWAVHERTRQSGGVDGPYAQAKVGRHSTIFLHTLITGWPMTDHRNHNGLDCQRSNLRPATFSQNGANQRPRAGCTSRFKGVSRCPTGWLARIRINGRLLYLGIHPTEEAAAGAYDVAAYEAWGEYACLNFG